MKRPRVLGRLALAAAGAVIFGGAASAVSAAEPAPVLTTSADPALQPLLDQLNVISQRLAQENQADQLGQDQLEQAQVLFQLAQQCQEKDRAGWLRLMVDSSYSAALQSSGERSAAYEWLQHLPELITRLAPGSPVASYASRQEIQAGYQLDQARVGEKAAKQHLSERLLQFAQNWPEAPEAPTAAMEAGRLREALQMTDAACQCYRYLSQHFAGNGLAREAAVSLRRLTLTGDRVELRLPLLYATGDHSAQTFDLADLRGKMVVVYFWSSTSAQVTQDFEALRELTDRYGTHGVAVVYVNLDGDPETARAFLHGRLTNGVHVYQTGGLQGPAAERFGLETLPHAFIVGKDGVVLQNGLRMSQLAQVSSLW